VRGSQVDNLYAAGGDLSATADIIGPPPPNAIVIIAAPVQPGPAIVRYIRHDPSRRPALNSARRPIIVLLVLMTAMTAATVLLKLLLPGAGGSRGSVPSAAGTGAVEPLTAEREARAWSRIEIRTADLDADRSTYHFVIAPVSGADGAVTSVRPLWKRQQVSPLDDPARAGDAVFIALTAPRAGLSPRPAQWQALGLLVQQLQGRYGPGRIALDAELRADPHSRGIRTAAGW
jgi:hypothetical protein